MNITEKTVGEIVAGDYRTARVFEKHGVDFCCGGNVAVGVVCSEKGVPVAMLEQELDAATHTPAEVGQDYIAWELPFLVDYIINVHHAYLTEHLPHIAGYAHKIATVHGARHPEVIEIAARFDKIADDLMTHLREEEDIFFPAIKRAWAARQAFTTPQESDREIIRTSLTTLGHDHEAIGNAVHAIRHLARDFAIPDDVCNTFVLTYHQLQEFEDDLHKHIHLENNILFLKAVQAWL